MTPVTNTLERIHAMNVKQYNGKASKVQKIKGALVTKIDCGKEIVIVQTNPDKTKFVTKER